MVYFLSALMICLKSFSFAEKIKNNIGRSAMPKENSFLNKTKNQNSLIDFQAKILVGAKFCSRPRFFLHVNAIIMISVIIQIVFR